MPILQGDVKFKLARVMADTAEGGGAPTAADVVDGASNAIFDDISDMDRALGDVSLRKVFLAVETSDTDKYLGANVCIAEPPTDPNVSVAILQVTDFFSDRAAAKSRLESYLAPGTTYAGYVFGNALAGSQMLTLLQRENSTLPNISDTLFLTKNKGLVSEFTQPVKVTAVSSRVRAFDDEKGSYSRVEVTLSLSDALQADFQGFDASRIDPTTDAMGYKTTVYDSVVADAVRVFGTVPLAEPAALDSFTIKTTGIHARVVPSAQVEAPIADARTSNESAALVAAGASVVQTVSATFTTTQALFIGARALPGSLSITGGAVTLTDNGGRLEQGGTQVGVVDYENGIATLSTNAFGTGVLSLTITYVPAAEQTQVDRSLGIPITANNRSLSYVLTLVPPARGSLSISYLSGGRWYVLRDDGAGAVRGADSAYGIGNLNFNTGTLAMTLGALPDVGSAIIVQWSEATTALVTTNTALRFGGKLFTPINTDGAASTAKGARPYKPNCVRVEWATGKVATDNGGGILSGDATGIVDYQNGVLYLAPNVLPADDAVFLVKQESTPGTPATGAVATTATGLVWTNSGTTKTVALGQSVAAGSLSFGVWIDAHGTVSGLPAGATYSSNWAPERKQVTDDGAGNLKIDGQTVGSVNYSTGALSIDSSLFNANSSLTAWQQDIYVTQADPSVGGPFTLGRLGAIGGFTYGAATFFPDTSVVFVPGSASNTTIDPVSVVVGEWFAQIEYMAANHTLRDVSFDLGAKRHVAAADGTLRTDINHATGTGLPVGTVLASQGLVSLQSWPLGASNALTNWRGVQAPPLSGDVDLSASFALTFRTAAAPLRAGSLSVIGSMADGTPINVTAGLDGKINTTRVKGRVNFETGVVELVFCNPSATSYGTVDVSYLQIAGVTTVNADVVRAGSLRYNAVSYSYIPLDASIIGVNPVRLPSDGRVPIIRAGSVIVIGNTASTTPGTVSNGAVINCGRVRLSRAKLVGSDGMPINTGYTADLEAGTVTITDVTGFVQPVHVEHRVEDMALVADAQINGEIRLTRKLTHNYTASGTYVSSAMLLGDMSARAESMFDQATWDGISWGDAVSGSVASASYNNVDHPVVVLNDGAVTERWALRFTSTTAFQIVGEHLGVIGTGSINTATAPINPNTGTPYWSLSELGWGIGWSIGNILRFNTVGAMAPVWLLRTVQQGPEAGLNHQVKLLGRGSVDRP